VAAAAAPAATAASKTAATVAAKVAASTGCTSMAVSQPAAPKRKAKRNYLHEVEIGDEKHSSSTDDRSSRQTPKISFWSFEMKEKKKTKKKKST